MSEELVNGIIKNVEPMILNVERPTVNEESITAASSATKTTRKSLQLLKLPKDIQDIDCKDILVKFIGLLKNDRNYFIGPAQIIQLRKTELDILKTFCLSMNCIHIVNAIVTHMYVILSSFTFCTLFSEGKKNIWRQLYKALSQNNSDYYLAWDELFNVLPRPSVVVNEDLLRQKLSFKLLQLLIIENTISQIEIFPLSEEILTD